MYGTGATTLCRLTLGFSVHSQVCTSSGGYYFFAQLAPLRCPPSEQAIVLHPPRRGGLNASSAIAGKRKLLSLGAIFGTPISPGSSVGAIYPYFQRCIYRLQIIYFLIHANSRQYLINFTHPPHTVIHIPNHPTAQPTRPFNNPTIQQFY